MNCELGKYLSLGAIGYLLYSMHNDTIKNEGNLPVEVMDPAPQEQVVVAPKQVVQEPVVAPAPEPVVVPEQLVQGVNNVAYPQPGPSVNVQGVVGDSGNPPAGTATASVPVPGIETGDNQFAQMNNPAAGPGLMMPPNGLSVSDPSLNEASLNAIPTNGIAPGMVGGVPSAAGESSNFGSLDNVFQTLKPSVGPEFTNKNDQRLDTQDLLPDEIDSVWSRVNPNAISNELRKRNFLFVPQRHLGVDTIGQSSKNSNLQLRSEPACPRVIISPFLNSSIDNRDHYRRKLEIGGPCGENCMW